MSVTWKNSLLYRQWYVILTCTIENFFFIDKWDLFIWNGNIAHKVSVVLRINGRYAQITGNQQKTVYTVRIIMHFRINNTCINIGCNTLTTQKFMEIFYDFRIGRFDNFSDNIITSCWLPKCFCGTFVGDIVNNWPWIENLCTSEKITVIPFAYFIIFFICFIVIKHFFDFFFCETEILAVCVIKQGIDFKVVQTTENTFFCNTQNACKKTIGKVRIIF